MDFLVPGALFGIALLAVIVLVIMISAEARTKRQNAAKPKVTTTENLSEKPLEIKTPETPAAVIVTTPLEPTSNQASPLLHDQLQNLPLELSNLHQHVYEIEQKLETLTSRIVHIEHMYNGHIHVEEEQETLEIPQTPEALLEEYPTQSS